MNSDFTIPRDRYYTIDGTAKDADDVVIDISDPAKITFKMVSLRDASKTLTKTTAVATEIDKLVDASGTYRIFIQAADTKTLPAGYYRYEVAYQDDPATTVEAYTLNPTSDEYGILLLDEEVVVL